MSTTPLRGPYYVQNRLLSAILGAVDLALGALLRPRRGSRPHEPPRRLLLACGGHLGDAVIASSVIPMLGAAWPSVEIGVLIGSWARPVLGDHPDVRWVHEMDHWKLNRSPRGPASRLRRHLSSRRSALREIRGVRYDMAIDLHPYFPNAIPLLWRAGIPIRIGYTSAGFGPMLTHPLAWQDSDRHRVDYHADLLRQAGIEVAPGTSLRYSLPRVADRPPPGTIPPDDYLLLHMGAGLPIKEWPRERWAELIDELLAAGHTLVFTGSGEEQGREAQALVAGRSNCFDLCNRLDWSGFVAAVAAARLVVCVDSVAGHVAGAVGTPVVVLTSGINRPGHWIPVGDRAAIVTHPVPCAPCFRSRGCPEMACVRGIGVDAVLATVRETLPPADQSQAIGAGA
jgi:ADP-heptose:LPS heptosyltransferase